MGGGNSRIKVDGIQPKKKMELGSVGNEDYLNFIKINNTLADVDININGNRMDRLITLVKSEKYVYAIATYRTWEVSTPTFVIRYNLKTGWDKYFGIEIGVDVANREGVVSAILINDDELLMSSYKRIVKINLKTKEKEDILNNEPSAEKAILFKLEKEIYLLADAYRSPQVGYVYRINVENKNLTQVAYNGDVYFDNVFEHNGGIWINGSNGHYILKDNKFTSIGTYPSLARNCIKINEKVHTFYLSDSESNEHYVLNDTGTWTKKENLSTDGDFIINTDGLNTDIGFIQIKRNSANTFEIITDKLFLEKRRE